ncbi:MAG: Bifunctional glucose-6-phosphate/mannose-6-phosphate isomerase-like protein [Jatrophihabitantaceae bacterium]|nr:Bifunctional glucose-6-phosphate/mannose-6-phosphate isomerase-like protein [Jatrophihabitantaceae bacterium]
MTPAFDEDVLGDPALIALRDPAAVLMELAGAGASIRRAVTVAPEWITEDLRSIGTPRAILIANDAPGSLLVDVVTAIAAGGAPVTAWEQDEPPRWAGPGDALLVASADGWAPRLSRLVELAARRGMAIAVAAPAQTPLEAAARQTRSALAIVAAQRSARATGWTLLTPLLQALDALGAAAVPPALLLEVADALDDIAAACSPTADPIVNPAKLLALELGEARIVLAGSGLLGAAAARRLAGSLALMAGEPAVLAVLPGDSGAVTSVLGRTDAADDGDDQLDDLFRDRVEDPHVPQRLLIFEDVARPDGDRAAATLEGIARTFSVRSSVMPAPGAAPLTRFAAASALGDFAAAYLALVRSVDPGALRAGEAPDLYRAGT